MSNPYRKAGVASDSESESEDAQYVLATGGVQNDRTPTAATYHTVSSTDDEAADVAAFHVDPLNRQSLPDGPTTSTSQVLLHNASTTSDLPYASSSSSSHNHQEASLLSPLPPGLWGSSSTVYLSAMTTPVQPHPPHNTHHSPAIDRPPPMPLARDEEQGGSSPLPKNGIVDLGAEIEQQDPADHRPTVKMKLPRDSDVHDVSYTYSRPMYTRQESETGLSSGLTSPNGTDYEDSSDEYDWSGEEDLADEAGKYVEKFGKKQKKKGWGPKRLFSLAFSSLIGSTLTAGLVALPAIIVHFYWYLPNPTEQRKYVAQNIQAWLFWVAANIVISWYLAMFIDVIPIVVQYFLAAAWGHVSEAVKSRMETYEAVKNTAKPAFYGASWLASWVIIFEHIYGLYDEDEGVKSRAPYTERVRQVVLFLFFLILVLCAQKMLTHYVAFNFHKVAYKDRIEVVEKRLSVLEKLQQYRPKKPLHGKSASSGTRTPFNNYRMSGSHLPYDMNQLNARLTALGSHPQRPPMSRLASNVSIPGRDTGVEGDEEDVDRTLVNKKGKLRKPRKTTSWFRRGKKPSEEDPISLQELALEEKTHNFKGTTMEKPPRSASSPGPSRDASPSRHFISGSTSNDSHTPEGSDGRPSHRRMKSGLGTPDRVGLAAVGQAVKKAVLHDARNISGKEQDLSSLAWNVASTAEAKRLAKVLFNRFRDRRRKYLIASDFYPAFRTHEEAEEAFDVIDEDGNGDLSRPEIKRVLVKTYQERRFLSRSLRDAGEAVNTLDWILFFFAMVILFLISLSVFGVNIGDSLTSVYSVMIAASFIFKNSASKAFDAIMFLFVTHPFDTGDRVLILDENLVVKRMGLFATTFTRADGTETYYFNSMLFQQFITNTRRSGKTTEMMNMQVAWKTPLEKLDALDKRLNDWISTEENRWYLPTGVTLQHIIYQKYLTLTVGIAHNGNWQDWGLRNARKTTFHAAAQAYCRELGIIGYEAPLPVAFTEPDAKTIDELANANDDDAISLAPSVDRQKLDVEIEEAAKSAKPSLGFLPPMPERSNRLLRARKSRHSKKQRLGAMNAEC